MAQSVDAVPSKGTVLRDVWVRVPPAALPALFPGLARLAAGSGAPDPCRQPRISRRANELVDARVRRCAVALAPNCAIELCDRDPGVTQLPDGARATRRRTHIRCRSLRRGGPGPLSALGTPGSATAAERGNAGDREDRDNHSEADQQAWVHVAIRISATRSRSEGPRGPGTTVTVTELGREVHRETPDDLPTGASPSPWSIAPIRGSPRAVLRVQAVAGSRDGGAEESGGL